ncbi:MAG: glycosyltransferase family 4 protein [Planctomycetaceae bacterium]
MGLESSIQSTGRFRLGKAVHVLRQSLKILFSAFKSDRAYLIISSSRFGFIKDFIAIWICFLSRCPITVHLNGGGYTKFYNDQPGFIQQVISITLNRTESIIVLGELLKKQFHFVSQPRIVIIPNGVPAPGESRPLRTLKLPPAQGQTWEFLYLSNLMHTKGYLAAAKAFAELILENQLNVSIHFCGSFLHSSIEGSENVSERHRVQFHSLIHDPQLRGRLVYYGHADDSMKKRMLERCHSFLLPTEYPGEGQPLSIIEAMSFGLPTIATRHAAIPEMIQDGENGILLASASTTDIKNAVIRMITQPQSQYASMSRQSIRRYRVDFTKEQHLFRLSSVLGIPQPAAIESEDSIAA